MKAQRRKRPLPAARGVRVLGSWRADPVVGVVTPVRPVSQWPATFLRQQQPQQTGVPPIIMQQVQPAFRQAAMQSQQPWIIASHILSPLVQVTVQPSLVISHLHMPIVMLQQHTIMPFIMQQQETMPPAIIAQRFCIIAQAAGSVQTHVIFIPPAHLSTFIVQRGTITMFGAIVPEEAGIAEPPIPTPAIPIVGRSIIIVPVMLVTPFWRLAPVRKPGPGSPT
jgi:hypothetical protein